MRKRPVEPGIRPDWGGGKLPLIQRHQVGSEIHFFIFDTQFVSDVVSVKLNGSGRQVAQFSDIFCGFALFDEVGHLNFGGC